jgi:hypothetical protein
MSPVGDPGEANRRTKARAHLPCGVSTCSSRVHGLSRYCTKHHHQALRYGAPGQTRTLRRHTAPFERVVSRLLTANSDHPAIALVIGELDALLVQATKAAAIKPSPGRQDWQAKVNVELARIYSAGITGRDVLQTVAGLWFYAKANRTQLPAGRPLQFAMARHVLTLVHRQTYGGWCNRKDFKGWVDVKGTVRLSTKVCEALGKHLAVSLCGVLTAMEGAYDELIGAPEDRRRRLMEALAQPFQ